MVDGDNESLAGQPRPRLARHAFWSEWAWDALARDLLTLDEAIQQLQLQLLYRRCGVL